MGSRKNIKQEKNKGSNEIFDMMEEIYSRGRYLGKKRKFEKCRGVNRRVRTKESSSKMTRER